MSQNSLSDHPMRQVFRYLRPFRGEFVAACTWSVLNKIFDLMPPILVGWVIDSVSRQPPQWIGNVVGTDDPLTLAAFLAILGVGIFALESFFQWRYQLGFMSLAQKVQHGLRMDAYNHIQTREIRFFENHRMGETMAMLNDDVNQLERFLNSGFNRLLQLLILFVFCGFVLFSTSWQMALIGMIPMPFVLWGSIYYQSTISPRYRRMRETVGELSSRLENNIAGIMVTKSFTAEAFESQRVAIASENYRQANFDAIKLSSIYVPLIRTAIAFGFGGVLLVGSYWVLKDHGILTVGELVLFAMMIQRMLWPLTELGMTLDEYERAKASARRTFGLLATPSTIVDPPSPKPLGAVQGEVAFDDVVFRYDHGPAVVNKLSFTIKPSETIGFAGATGAGKSTLVKLLLRFYDANQGAVRIDGVDVRELAQTELRRNISLVSQDVYLFHGSIAENIAYGEPEATREQIVKMAKLAQVDDFISTLPDGYDTIVGERGIKLSGGQRQRLSIARALLKDAPIMIFDEATSSVDTETERAIQENLLKLTEGKTALIIAHRLSTIRHADRILVLKDGRISEEGRHDELIGMNQTYADLWHIQLGDLAAPRPSQQGVEISASN